MSDLQKIYRNGDWVLYLDYKALADRIEELEAKLNLSEGALDVASKSWSECQRILEQTEAKLAKCQALMHAGLAEYQRRLVRSLEALDALADCVDDGCHRSEMRMATAMDHARTVLEELEGEIDARPD